MLRGKTELVAVVIGVIALVAASYWGTRTYTLSRLTGQDVIFETFEQVDETWLYSDKIGAAAASDVERARVAIGGPLGLSSKEAVYFVSVTDDQGNPLRSQCTYRVSGGSIDSRWWSLALYDSETQHYVPNEQNRSSWNSVSIPKSDSDEWVINVSPSPQETAWLPTQKAPEKPFELMLRIYNPSDSLRAALPNIDLPKVERVSC